MPRSRPSPSNHEVCYNNKVQQNNENLKAKKAQVVVFNKKNNNTYVLLLQTNKDRGEFWQNITGGVDEDESFQEGAKRELLEETGIDQEVHNTELSFQFHDRWGKDVTEKVFWTLSDHSVVQISNDEHQNFQWVNVKDITQDHYGYPNNFQAFKESLKCLES